MAWVKGGITSLVCEPDAKNWKPWIVQYLTTEAQSHGGNTTTS
jgi:hypothetical protein